MLARDASWLVGGMFALLACSSSGTKIPISSQFDATTITQADKDKVSQFYVIVGAASNATGDESLFFYPKCLPTSVSPSCLCPGCAGFSKDDTAFFPELENIDPDATMSVVLCAMDKDQNIVASGFVEGVLNSAPTDEILITLKSPTSEPACDKKIPDLCGTPTPKDCAGKTP